MSDSVEAVCANLHERLARLPVLKFPYDAEHVPKNGIYVLYENGELGHGASRIVRIGTHTGDNQLRSRLRQHFVDESKDRSIFRKNIGRCLLRRADDPFLQYWELDLTSRAAKDLHRGSFDQTQQKQVEAEVTAYIQRAFHFVVIEVPKKDQRLQLESKLVSTVSACMDCQPSKEWLGKWSPKERIRVSGLWQVNELYKAPFVLSELITLVQQ